MIHWNLVDCQFKVQMMLALLENGLEYFLNILNLMMMVYLLGDIYKILIIDGNIIKILCVDYRLVHLLEFKIKLINI